MPRVIGILGVSYCGSTILNLILDGINGIIGAGETHWMHDAQYEAGRSEYCKTCGPACPIFTEDFIEEAKTNTENWWERIAKAAKADTVVSTDKVGTCFDVLGLPDVIILLFRDPRAWIFSWMFRYNTTVEQTMNLWIKSHEQILDWLRQRGLDYISIDWTEFARRPHEGLEDLCAYLEVPFAPEVLEFWKYRHHHIGGNDRYTTKAIASLDGDLIADFYARFGNDQANESAALNLYHKLKGMAE